MPATLTSKRWKDLLDGVKAKLGDGEVSRFSSWRRYRCKTSTGRPFFLALGSWPTDDEAWLFPYVEAKSKAALPGEIRLGDNAAFMLGASKRWKDVPGLEPEFVSKYKPICTDQAFARSVLSERARSIIEDLEGIPPRGITVLVKKRSIVAYKIQQVLSVDDLARFVTAGMELADIVL